MSAKRLITVFGATGNQGGSVISVILSHSNLAAKYSLRGISRDPTSGSSQKLVSQGVEMVKADLDDADSLRQAVQGSYGVFGVTDYWATTDKNVEIRQGKSLVDACLDENVQHLVWSSLPNVTKLTNGELTKVEHFDSKAEVGEYADKHRGKMIVTWFMPGYFMSNIKGQVRPDESGIPTLSLPWNPKHTRVPLLDVRSDSGKFVAGILEAEKEADGHHVHAVSEWSDPTTISEVISQEAGCEVRFQENHLTLEMISKMGRIPEELMQNMFLIRDYSYFGKGSDNHQAASNKFLLHGTKTVSWAEFVHKNGPWQW